LVYQVSFKSHQLQQSYDVILIFQDGGRGIAIILSVPGLVTSAI